MNLAMGRSNGYLTPVECRFLLITHLHLYRTFVPLGVLTRQRLSVFSKGE